jgi:uroporphyrinogen decarboxylase
LNSRERFLRACQSRPLERPPLWLMRQAGRALPEYRELKERYSFLQLVQTPELAAEVTLQPIRRFGFDAAILFSDILVVSEAIGQGYSFRDKGGVAMDFAIRTAADVDRLCAKAVRERLQYVSDALPLIRRELGGRTALLGFSGSPWTLACFMTEGGSAREFTAAKRLFYADRELFDRLNRELTVAVIEFLQLQIDAGVDAVQIFDSLGGVLGSSAFEEASAKSIREIIAALNHQVPVIVFSKGTHDHWGSLARTGAQVVGVDWTVDLAGVHSLLPEGVGVQGNLDPVLLTTTPTAVAAETRRILQSMNGRSGHIFNLGHGVPPTARLDCIEALVETVRSFP